MMKIFDRDKRWYKGNLHTHTTISDGFLTLEDCIDAYKQRGYDFMAVTDHRKYFPGRFEDDFLVFAGEEFMHEDKVRWTAYHIIGINQDSHFETDNDSDPQFIIDEIKKRGGLVVMGHPMWSLMSHEEINELHGIDATEALSGISEEYSGRGNSIGYADVLATMNQPLLLFGVDDMHFVSRDLARCWIMLQTDDFSREGVMDAVYRGQFYATEGPSIINLEREGDVVRVDTSELNSIYFLSNTWYNAKRVIKNDDGTSVNHGEYVFAHEDKWVRIEGPDSKGMKFTTNYIFK